MKTFVLLVLLAGVIVLIVTAPKEHSETSPYGRDPYKISKQEHHDAVQQAIAEHQLVDGMTYQEVVASWGEPDKMNRTVTHGVTMDQLVFLEGNYAYLEDGRLTSWQQSADPGPLQREKRAAAMAASATPAQYPAGLQGSALDQKAHR